jgi:hypothetical protein
MRALTVPQTTRADPMTGAIIHAIVAVYDERFEVCVNREWWLDPQGQHISTTMTRMHGIDDPRLAKAAKVPLDQFVAGRW